MKFFTLLILCGGIWWAVSILRERKPQSTTSIKKYIENNKQDTKKDVEEFFISESEGTNSHAPEKSAQTKQAVASVYEEQSGKYLDDFYENEDCISDEEEPIRYLPDGTPIETVYVPTKQIKELEYPIPFIQDIRSVGFSASSAPRPRISPSEVKGRQEKLLEYLGRKELSSKEVGDRYERYIGYLYERAGWNVYYNGLIHGTADCGIDLICCSKKETHLVQAKRWSKKKQVEQKHIIDLLLSFEYFAKMKNISNAKPVFITTTSLTEQAKEFSGTQNILVLECFTIKSHPVIKCITGARGGRKYLLPYMEQKKPQRLHDEVCGAWEPYDMASVNFHQGDCYVHTIRQAEELGYRYSNK